MTPIEFPRYVCHKEVRAIKIGDVIRTTDHYKPVVMILPENRNYPGFEVSAAYDMKHHPHPGGYYVLYGDGYESYSPAEAFESGYTRVTPFIEPVTTASLRA